VALIASYIILCPLIPATPMMVAGGMVFGPVMGTIYNLIGTFLGGTTTYYLGRGLGRDFVLHVAGKRLKKVERAISRRGFWSLIGVRFLPLPFPVVNYCAALAGVRPALFMITTLIGLVPGVAVFTYFASLLAKTAEADKSGLILQFIVASLILLLFTVIPQIYTIRKRRQRYRELRGQRQVRNAAPQAPQPSPSLKNGREA
jgi:uncharacterized membrane protein YdjX (TVP38/TMEM64 family)